MKQRDADVLVAVTPVYSLQFGLLCKLMNAVMVPPMYRSGMRRLLDGLRRQVEG